MCEFYFLVVRSTLARVKKEKVKVSKKYELLEYDQDQSNRKNQRSGSGRSIRLTNSLFFLILTDA